MDAEQGRLAQESIRQSKSRWRGELLSLCRDVLTNSHGRDYRSLRILFLGEFAARNIRVRVFDIIAMNKNEPRLRINVFCKGGFQTIMAIR